MKCLLLLTMLPAILALTVSDVAALDVNKVQFAHSLGKQMEAVEPGN